MSGAVRHLAVVVALGSLAFGAAGCSQLDHRTGPKTLDKAMTKAFKRASAAAYRMTTNHADRNVVSYARFRCRPRGPEPKTDADWSWFCKVLWLPRDRPEHHHLATYGVSVDKRGCFEAVSDNFAPRLPERVLGRQAPNPLVYIRSCP